MGVDLPRGIHPIAVTAQPQLGGKTQPPQQTSNKTGRNGVGPTGVLLGQRLGKGGKTGFGAQIAGTTGIRSVRLQGAPCARYALARCRGCARGFVGLWDAQLLGAGFRKAIAFASDQPFYQYRM